MEAFSIKEIDKAEWEKFRDIRIRAVEECPQAFADSLDETKQRDMETWLRWISGAHNYVVEVDGVFVALGTFRKVETNTWVINGIWTDPRYRGQGMSSAIMRHILQTARDTGVSTIHLEVNPQQTDAQRLYEKFGFVQIGNTSEKTLGDGNQYTNIIMEIRL